MTEIEQLQAWYEAQCDGDWEHSHGVRIETLDNPGWSVTIALEGTALEAVTYAEVRDMAPARDWIICRREASENGPVWRGAGGPLMLGRILRHFLDWAATGQPAT